MKPRKNREKNIRSDYLWEKSDNISRFCQLSSEIDIKLPVVWISTCGREPP